MFSAVHLAKGRKGVTQGREQNQGDQLSTWERMGALGGRGVDGACPVLKVWQAALVDGLQVGGGRRRIKDDS